MQSVKCIFLQAEVTHCDEPETAVSDLQLPVEITGCQLQPVVELEELNLTR